MEVILNEESHQQGSQLMEAGSKKSGVSRSLQFIAFSHQLSARVHKFLVISGKWRAHKIKDKSKKIKVESGKWGTYEIYPSIKN